MAEAAGRPVALVGQSMGGTVAREVARVRPDLVDRLITLGTPLFRPRSNRPIRCPVTVLYSQVDRIVPPRWAIDDTPGVENIEISSTHFGMGIDPDVWRLVAERLQPVTASQGDRSTTAR
jgi:pimeloyl-ACP methyl ester carboxylesterase